MEGKKGGKEGRRKKNYEEMAHVMMEGYIKSHSLPSASWWPRHTEIMVNQLSEYPLSQSS